MSCIADFNDADRWVVETALKERYGKIVSTEPADAEIKLDPASPSSPSTPLCTGNRTASNS